MQTIKISYRHIVACPLCGGIGAHRASLSRADYFFGSYRIPLPDTGVQLCECQECGLLFKSAVPDFVDLSKVMAGAASGVWKPKRSTHPALPWIMRYVENAPRVLDIGASHGDLLAQVKRYASVVSALDIVRYPRCAEVVNGEYIIGDLETRFSWCGDRYHIVTAFDVFEHFVNARAALGGIESLMNEGGRLIVETGDWRCVTSNLGSWYYANLFEHHIFWTRMAFDFACHRFGLEILEYTHVPHKIRRQMSGIRRLAIEIVVLLSRFRTFQWFTLRVGGGDPRRFPRPSVVDHAFVVLEKRNAQR